MGRWCKYKRKITNLQYDNDITIIRSSKQFFFFTLLHQLENISKPAALIINREKTKIMIRTRAHTEKRSHCVHLELMSVSDAFYAVMGRLNVLHYISFAVLFQPDVALSEEVDILPLF